MKLMLIIEKGGGKEIFGRIEDKGEFLPITVGSTITQVITNIKKLILDYQTHDGANDRFWKKVDVKTVEFDIHYDLRGFFKETTYLNLPQLEARLGIRKGTLEKYASGQKYSTQDDAVKLKLSLKSLGKELAEAKLF